MLAADGGIREQTVPVLRAAGAETVVLGSLAFGAPDLGRAWPGCTASEVTGPSPSASTSAARSLRAALVDAAGRVAARIALATRGAGGARRRRSARSPRRWRAVSRGVEPAASAASGSRRRGRSTPAGASRCRLPTLAGFADFPLAAAARPAAGAAGPAGERRHRRGARRVALRRRARAARTSSTSPSAPASAAAAVVDGRVLRGRMGLAGHVGHMTIVRDGAPCPCGNRGCWEAYAAGPAFAARASPRLGRPMDGGRRLRRRGRRRRRSPASSWPRRPTSSASASPTSSTSTAPRSSSSAAASRTASTPSAPASPPASRVAAMPSFRDVPVLPAALGGNAGLVGAGILVLDPAA